MKLSPRIKLTILTIIALTIVAVITTLVILPIQNRIKTLSKNIYDQRVDFEFIFQQRRNATLLEREINEMENNRQKISSALFSKNDTLKLITSLEKIAQDNNLQNQKLNLSETSAQSSGLSLSSLTIEFSSDYPDFINWLEEIEKQPYYLIIDSVDLRANPIGASSGNTISLAVYTKIYWQ